MEEGQQQRKTVEGHRSNVVEGTVNIKDVEADETGQKTIDI